MSLHGIHGGCVRPCTHRHNYFVGGARGRTDTAISASSLAHHLTPACAQPLDPGPLEASPAHKV